MQYVNKDVMPLHALRQENVILQRKINQILAQTARGGRRGKASADTIVDGEGSGGVNETTDGAKEALSNDSNGLRRRKLKKSVPMHHRVQDCKQKPRSN